jgi:hypothetical protein
MAHGCLVVADITGYTAYLSESELEHARDSLSAILDLLLEHTTAPLVVSRLEGDAVVSYALERSFLQGQTIVEIIESTYVHFRRALETMVLNTTCTCNACRNIPSLDLKFFVHYGEFLTQQLGGHVELVGSDVNLLHRLAKNTIKATTGITAYTAYTEAAVEELAIEPFFAAMPLHQETYEHLGTITLRIQDMAAVWGREREETRVRVAPDEAFQSVAFELPVDRVLAWEYVTEPEFRALLGGYRNAAVEYGPHGRLGRGSVYVCMHGTTPDPNHIVDWQPFDEYTFEANGAMPRVRTMITVRFGSTDGGTIITSSFGRSRGPALLRHLNDAMLRAMAPMMLRRSAERLRRAVAGDVGTRREGAAEGDRADDDEAGRATVLT